MWQKKESKLKLAASMVRQVMSEFTDKKRVVILCGSWYMKQDLISVTEEYPNLDMIGNVRYDSVMYNLPPKPTGRREDPPNGAENFPSKQISHFLTKKPGITIQMYAVYLRIFLVQER